MPNTHTSVGVAVATDVYATLAELRADPTLKLAAGETADDALLQALLNAVKTLIDRTTGRTFAASVNTTRYFDAVRDVEGAVLYLKDDLAAINSITNGDGDILTTNEYVTLPANLLYVDHAYYSPLWAIKLLASSSLAWTYTTDPENAIAVSGKWAYSASAPNDIKRANIIGAAALYRQSLSGDSDRPIVAGGGIVIQPSQLPKSFWLLLDKYVRKI